MATVRRATLGVAADAALGGGGERQRRVVVLDAPYAMLQKLSPAPVELDGRGVDGLNHVTLDLLGYHVSIAR